MKLSFRRITSSGTFIPELDGLRFIAIAGVILFHFQGFLNIKYKSHNAPDIFNYTFLKQVAAHGYLGVHLFFMISGFILGIPFAQHYLKKKPAVNLRRYFLRRLTRIELPYILVMTLMLFCVVFIRKSIPVDLGIISYLSSLVYCHNFVFPNDMPLLNGVAWSLEVEIQFYILAPLMCRVFAIKSPGKRRILLIAAAVFFIAMNRLNIISVYLNRSILGYCQYFVTGLLLADLYVSKSKIFSKTKIDYLIGLFFFSAIWIIDYQYFTFDWQKCLWELGMITCMFLMCYYVLFHKVFKLLSFKYVTIIGGMCYSIYLIHQPVMSLIGNPLIKHSFSKSNSIDILIYGAILIPVALAASAVFYLLVERPSMYNIWKKKNVKHTYLDSDQN